MAPKARVGLDTVGGGLITGPGATTVLVGGAPAATIGSTVAPHAPFTGLHNTAVLSTGSPTVKAEGKAVCRIGDLASCGHAIATGDVTVDAN